MPVRSYVKNRRAAGLVEYGLMVGLVAVAAVVAVDRTGGAVANLMDAIAGGLDAVPAAGAAAQAPATGPTPGDAGPGGMIYAGSTPSGSDVFVASLAEQGWGAAEADRKLWASARDDCLALNAHGESEWRLPTLVELRVLHDAYTSGAITTFNSSLYHWTGDYVGENASGQSAFQVKRFWDGDENYLLHVNTQATRCVHVPG